MGHDGSKHGGHSKKSYSPSRASPNTAGIIPTNTTRNDDLSNFAVISVIFNPVKYNSRYDHYRRFAQHMSQCGVTLYTVECIFESAPQFSLPRQDFEITRAGDRHHFQLIAPSIIWMKENLINVAVQRLPQHIEYIAWIDADVEFERLDWAQLAVNELQRYPIVQLFELSYFLGPGGKRDILRRDYSFGYSIRHNKPIQPGHSNDWYAHPGYAWAMRRSAFNTIGGLIDFCIIGSGDLHFAFALLNRIEDTLRPGLHQDYRSLAITWGKKVAQVAQNGSNVSYVPVNLLHHWHGERKDRHYVDRWMILEKHNFSPLNDLEKNDNTGLLRLADKRNYGRPELVARMDAFELDIVAYFISRNEDNNAKTNQAQQPPPVKPNQAQRPPPAKSKPFVATKTQPNRGGGGMKHANIPPRKWTGTSSTRPIWSSGPSGTHVEDEHPFWDQCICPGHHHIDGNHGCPCSSVHDHDHHHHHHGHNQPIEQECWEPTDHHGHNHPIEQECWEPTDHHGHNHPNEQQCWEPTDHHGGHHHDYSSSGHHHDYSSSGHHHDYSSGGHHHDYSSGGHHHDYSSGGHHHDYSSGGGYDYQSGGGTGDTGYSGPGSFY